VELTQVSVLCLHPGTRGCVGAISSLEARDRQPWVANNYMMLVQRLRTAACPARTAFYPSGLLARAFIWRFCVNKASNLWERCQPSWWKNFEGKTFTEAFNTPIREWSLKTITKGIVGSVAAYWTLKIANKQMNFDFMKLYNREKEGLTEKEGKIMRHMNRLDTRANAKAWIDEGLKRSLKFEMSPIDKSEEITRLLDLEPEKLTVVEGMKGVGKTYTLLKLCKQQMEKGPVLFLEFTDNSSDIEDIIKDSEVAFWRLLEHYNASEKQLTIVVDDFNKFLHEESGKGKTLTSLFWRASQLGARVIFTCSDYGLAESMRSYSSLRSIRCSFYRFKAPSNPILTDWIKSALQMEEVKRKQKIEKANQNSEDDIQHYCSTVGTLRDIISGFYKGMTVRETTEAVFVKTVDSLLSHFTTLLCTSELAGGATAAEKAVLKPALERLCGQLYVSGATIQEDSLFKKLVKINILRPAGGLEGNGCFEFHSFAVETALRILLNKPYPEVVPTIPYYVQVESKGSGSDSDISYFTARLQTKIDEAQKKFKMILAEFGPPPKPDESKP